jgi:tRNA (uracil-5-)-methyltransferase
VLWDSPTSHSRSLQLKKKDRLLITQLIEKYRHDGTAPACPHFGQCGGCLFQDMDYGDQLALKQQMVNDALQGIAAVDSVHPSDPYRYRGRMDMVTAFGRIGLRRRGSFRAVVDVTACSIMQEKSDRLYQKVRPLLEAVEGYDYLRHEGYLRYAVLREARYTGQVMLNFVVAEKENRLSAVIDGIIDETDSVSIIHHGGLADLSYGDIMETVKIGYIEESFDGIRYRITPNSFFQSNAEIAMLMYGRIRDHARGSVLDLCSGVGSISLFIAGAADRVTGIEMNPEAVEIARTNKSINDIGNVEFICGDAGGFLKNAAGSYDTIVMDPPRAGMQKGVMESIDRMNAGKIVYMSCNPKTFRDDVAVLRNYAVESVEAFDMFPQTPHVELLGILKPRPAAVRD